jgi:hypothetical protein
MKKLLFCGLLLVGITACKQGGVYEPFEGNWGGNYSGNEDFGPLEYTVNADGDLNGFMRSDTLNRKEKPILGRVDITGGFLAKGEAYGKEYVFEGNINENTASGNWSTADSTLSGIWRATKF